MSAQEFWHGNPRLAIAYRDAAKIKRQNKYQDEWRAGYYFYEALLTASPAFREISKGIRHAYPEKPVFTVDSLSGLTQEERDRQEMEKNRTNFLAMMEKFNQKFEEDN